MLPVARGQPQGPQGAPELRRHPEADGRRRRAPQGAALHRRHAEPQHDPDRRDRPPADEEAREGRRAAARGDRLPAAHRAGEPPRPAAGAGGADQPAAEVPGPRTEHPGGRAGPGEPRRPRTARTTSRGSRTCASRERSSRTPTPCMMLHRPGKFDGDAGGQHPRSHHRQAAQRPDRRDHADVPEAVHALRELHRRRRLRRRRSGLVTAGQSRRGQTGRSPLARDAASLFTSSASPGKQLVEFLVQQRPCRRPSPRPGPASRSAAWNCLGSSAGAASVPRSAPSPACRTAPSPPRRVLQPGQPARDRHVGDQVERAVEADRAARRDRVAADLQAKFSWWTRPFSTRTGTVISFASVIVVVVRPEELRDLARPPARPHRRLVDEVCPFTFALSGRRAGRGSRRAGTNRPPAWPGVGDRRQGVARAPRTPPA